MFNPPFTAKRYKCHLRQLLFDLSQKRPAWGEVEHPNEKTASSPNSRHRPSRVRVSQISWSPTLIDASADSAFEPGHGMANRSTTAQFTMAMRRWRPLAIVTLAAMAALTA